MKRRATNKSDDITLESIYPEFSADELAEASDVLTHYLHIIVRIHEQMRANPEAYERFRALTGREP